MREESVNFNWSNKDTQELFKNCNKGFSDKDRFRIHVDTLINLFNLRKTERIFDFGCGIGGHIKEFLERGYDIKGYDISKSYIENARSSINDLGISFPVFFEDFPLDVKYRNTFDFIYCIAFPIQYYDESELIKKFKELYSLLKGNKRFFMGFTYTCEFKEKHFTQHSWKEEPKGVFHLVDKKIDKNGKTTEVYITIDTIKDEIHRWEDICTYYTLSQIDLILKKSGFKPKLYFDNDLKKIKRKPLSVSAVYCENL